MSPWFFYNQRVRDISFPTHSLTVILSLWEKAPRMLRAWKIDEFNVLLYLGSQSRRRTETTLRHQDTPSCQIWKVVHRTVTHWRIAASLHEEEVAISLAFMSTHIFCCFYCSAYMFVGLYPRALKKIEGAWNHRSYMGDQKPVVGLGSQKQKFT